MGAIGVGRGALLALLVGTSALATGCASLGTSTMTYRAPDPVPVENEIDVERPAGETWDRVVQGLSKSFFVINNIDKESRLINVSFSTTRPQEYITGGSVRREFKEDAEAAVEVTEYDPAASSSYSLAGKWGTNQNLPSTMMMSRKCSLEGRVNIFLAPREAGTRITVNVRYVLSVAVSGKYLSKDAYGNVVGTGEVRPGSASAAFTTNQPNSFDWGTSMDPLVVSFRSTGRLEAEILALAR